MGTMIQTAIGAIEDPVERFFAFCQERENIRLRRVAGQEKPWSEDIILNQYRFTNIFREFDRTTLWFAKYVREPMRDRPEVLFATVLFRWFNRIMTGEAVFCQTLIGPLGSVMTAFWQYMEDDDPRGLRQAILSHCGNGPYVTGAYIIQTRGAPAGYSKLDGVIHLVGLFKKRNWKAKAEAMVIKPHSLQETCAWLQDSPSMGPFMAYEIVTDLRWTVLLEKAPDIDTWANPGPGAARGLNRLRERGIDATVPTQQMVGEMQKLLGISRFDARRWPREWSQWEMREVEHSLCEWDKYERVRTGQGRPRGVYK